MSLGKKQHEGFSKFFEEPTRHALRELLQFGVGETDNIDFKATFPEKTKLAKHVLALANAGGGVLIIGVADGETLESVGVEMLTDKADIQKQLKNFLPAALEYDVLDFSYKDAEYTTLKNKKFQVLIVNSDSKCLPYLCIKAGEDIKANVIYIRKGTNSTEASHDDVQRLINRRIETGYSSTGVLSLEEHLEQLKLLYKQISPTINKSLFASQILSLTKSLVESTPNPKYPSESYEDYISNLISLKKRRIERSIECSE